MCASSPTIREKQEKEKKFIIYFPNFHKGGLGGFCSIFFFSISVGMSGSCAFITYLNTFELQDYRSDQGSPNVLRVTVLQVSPGLSPTQSFLGITVIKVPIPCHQG